MYPEWFQIKLLFWNIFLNECEAMCQRECFKSCDSVLNINRIIHPQGKMSGGGGGLMSSDVGRVSGKDLSFFKAKRDTTLVQATWSSQALLISFCVHVASMNNVDLFLSSHGGENKPKVRKIRNKQNYNINYDFLLVQRQ